jgi:hypothetical protein
MASAAPALANPAVVPTPSQAAVRSQPIYFFLSLVFGEPAIGKS